MRKPSFAKHDLARECARNKMSISSSTTSKPKEKDFFKSGKSRRLSWVEHPRPDFGRENFTEDEEDLLIRLHALLGNRWSLIAGRLPGRTSSEVKRYWNAHLRRKLMSMGIDPDKHHVSLSQSLRNPTLLGQAMTRDNYVECEVSSSKAGNGQRHDAASDQEDNACLLPDLNLDLSISISSTAN